MTGYMHPGYAESLSEFGTPRELPRCGGWVLERQIPGFLYRDAMGCYPLFACQDWSKLASDLDNIGDDLVSLALVTDPFGEYEEAYLHRCFDVVIPFKEHFIADLRRPMSEIVSADRRNCARKAFKRGIQVETCVNPMQYIEDWIALYTTLTQRHGIKGINAFSGTAFAKQFSIPGLVALRAVHKEVTVGMELAFIQAQVAYGHLSAYSEVGYELRASCALYWSTIEHLADTVRWLNWGGGAGAKSDGMDGLSQFKRGWSTGTRTVYFCGRIFDHQGYAKIVKAKGIAATDYFPAYRKGEFR